MRMCTGAVELWHELTHKEEMRITGPILEEGDLGGLKTETAVYPPVWRGSLPGMCAWVGWSLQRRVTCVEEGFMLLFVSRQGGHVNVEI